MIREMASDMLEQGRYRAWYRMCEGEGEGEGEGECECECEGRLCEASGEYHSKIRGMLRHVIGSFAANATDTF